MPKSQRLSNLPNAPAFSAYGSGLQTVANNTYTKVQYNTEEFDTASNYDAATNYRFTPTASGYYQLNASITANGGTSGGVYIVLYKNGTVFKAGDYTPAGANGEAINLTALVYANGSTDYFEIYMWQDTGNSVSMGSSNNRFVFSGCLIRPDA